MRAEYAEGSVGKEEGSQSNKTRDSETEIEPTRAVNSLVWWAEGGLPGEVRCPGSEEFHQTNPEKDHTA